MVIDKFGIREQNEAVILQTIIRNQNISRIELSTLTQLNKASVSQITKKLIENQLVLEVGSGTSTASGGRKPIHLCFNGQSGVAAAFDIGYNYLKGKLAYIDGQPLNSITKQNITLTRENVLTAIQEIMTEFMATCPQTFYGLTGITLAIHGIVRQETIAFAPYYDLAGFDFQTPLQALYAAPIYIENEANLTALGEYCFAAEQKNLISISIHSGIGAGIVSNGQLQKGKHGFAGELGHSTLFPNGKPCPCGNQGCLEQYASNKVLFETLAHASSQIIGNSDAFVRAYLQKEPLAIELAQENVDFLSIGINNIITLFDPEIIFINSSVYRKLPVLTEKMQQVFNSRFTKEVQIKNSRLGEQAPLYGGIAVVASHFLNIQDLKFPNLLAAF